MNVIEVKNIKKSFKKPIRKPGIWGMLTTLFSTKYSVTEAVKNVSFNVQKGEIVGYIGANGAGKSTSIKMMCGILTPNEGQVLINGMEPYNDKHRKNVLADIGVVFGQRTQLWWDLPLIESLLILKEVYSVSKEDYDKRFNFLNETLDLNSFINQPIRTLSLGQRMRADLAASLIHNPKILFLDEPTIGLDVLVKEKIISAIKSIHDEFSTTIILTTHNMDDITDLCSRIIILDEGSILYDGPLTDIKTKFGDLRKISFSDKGQLDLVKFNEIYNNKLQIISNEGLIEISLDASKIKINNVLKYILDNSDISDINIQENSLESIVRKIYENKKV